MPTFDEVQDWPGRKLVGADGSKIGKVGEIYLDDRSGQPEWALVNTGLFGTRSSFVPITDARSDGDGAVMVPFDKHTVKDAPNVDEGDHLSPEEEASLYRYYGRTDYDHEAGSAPRREPGGLAADDDAHGRDDDAQARAASAGRERNPARGHLDRSRDDATDAGLERAPEPTTEDRPDPTPADAVTRAQDQVEVDVLEEQDGRLRLRRYVITEEVIEAPLPTDDDR
jgi:hypothetical protein